MKTEELIISRHKKESRDLVSVITGMKKQATKNTKKQVLKRIQEMESELKNKHKRELEELHNSNNFETDNIDNTATTDENNGTDDEITPEMLLAQLELEQKQNEADEKVKEAEQISQKQQPSKKKKRNRQREKLAKREEEIKKIQEEARLEKNDKPDLRSIELKNIEQLCDIQNLKQFDITPDGHCLFASIADQLKIRQEIGRTVKELRKTAAEYIRNNSDDFIPFLFDESTMSLKNVDEYTDKLENTAMWGGDLEILALAKAFNCPITVMMSGRAPLKMNEEGEGEDLKLVYYQHVFGLGEHYNSLHDA